MKKIGPFLMLALLLSVAGRAQRFLTEVFPSVLKTPNIIYANNMSFLSGSPVATDIRMDVYEPAGAADTMGKRPLVILMHTGNYLPVFYNSGPQGTRSDSTIVEICNRMARRGYVVASIDYRLGWNPTGSNVDIRRGTLINAVFRSIQDARSCVRYFKKDAGGSNTFKIDTTRIIIGGQGTGGYIALNYPCLKDSLQIQIPKFISNTNSPPFAAGFPYVSMSLYGDFDGFGGNPVYNNPANSIGHTSNVQFVFNMGGALGDSSWLSAGRPPMVSFHSKNDSNAPYLNGMVYVPIVPPQPVVEVSGSGYVIPKAVALGNNDCFKNAGFTDPYTMRANSLNGGAEGLFPIVVATPQSGPWEWFDSVATVNGAVAAGLSAAQGTGIYLNGIAQNPDMSKGKAMKYIDTIMNYLNPRIVYCMKLNGPTGISSFQKDPGVRIYPNPAAENFTVQSELAGNLMLQIRIQDLSGRVLSAVSGLHASRYTFNREFLAPGIYLITVETLQGRRTQKLILE